jgi:hypothetical protein
MDKIEFSTDQVQAIINVLIEIPAKNCFDVLLMIKNEVDKQTKKEDAGI